MGKPGILMLEVSDGWKIQSVAQSSLGTTITSLDPIEIATQTIAFAKQHAMDFAQIVIALESDSVLYATVPNDEALDLKNNLTLRFALESVLPVDAERIVADSIGQQSQGLNNTIAAVSMEVGHLKPIIDALEQVRCNVQFIVPASLLAMEQAIASHIAPVPSFTVWMLDQNIGPRRIEILELDSVGSLKNWQLIGFDAEAIEYHLLQLLTESSRLFLVGNRIELDQLTKVIRHESQSIELDRNELIRERTQLILAGRKAPWVDLRRDELAMQDPWRRDRSTLSRFAIAIAIFITTLCGTLFWRAQTYRSVADGNEQRQRELFRVAFPAQRVPAAILGRLKSEHTKSKGIRKTDPKSTAPSSALETLRSVIQSLGEDFPFEIEELRIENGRIAMQIELSSQQDAGKVAAALAKNGFDVEPPATTLIHGDRVLASLNALKIETAQ